MKRISVNLTPEQAAGLKERSALTGILQSELIRRAIDAALNSDEEKVRAARIAHNFGRGNQFAGEPGHEECCPSANRQPVLFAPKQETR